MYDRFKGLINCITFLQKVAKIVVFDVYSLSKIISRLNEKSVKCLNFCTVPACPTFAPNRVRQRKKSQYCTMWRKIHPNLKNISWNRFCTLKHSWFHEIFVKTCESKIPYIISTLTRCFFSSWSWSNFAFFHKRYKIPFDNCTNSTFFLHFFW